MSGRAAGQPQRMMPSVTDHGGVGTVSNFITPRRRAAAGDRSNKASEPHKGVIYGVHNFISSGFERSSEARGVSTNQVQASAKWSCDCVASVGNLAAICGTMPRAVVSP